MMKEGVEGGVLVGNDSAGDGLGEDVGIESSMAEMRPKVVNQYFILFSYLLKYVPMNFLGLAL